MDPLSALSVAGTVTQFVGFAIDLISNSSQIHDSVNGLSHDVSSIDTVYTKLRDFSRDLSISSMRWHESPTQPDRLDQIFSLQNLLKTCQEDCEKLLGIVQSLRYDDSDKSRRKSLRKAAITLWMGNDIRQLDKRLQRTQSALTFMVSSVSRLVFVSS